jgi:dienelactone hydrolase
MPIITIENIKINHREHKLNGRIYRTVGDTPKPSVIICIGYPGDTKHMDLAEELALHDINVLIFYYSGAWESEGTYSFTNLTPSTQSAINWLIQQPYTDPSRIALICHSMGSIPLTKYSAKLTG